MNFNIFLKILLILIISLSVGCDKYKTRKKVNSLDRTITSYGVALRWAEHDTLYAYYVSPNGTQPPVDMNRLKEISVTGLDVKEKTVNDDQTKANVKSVVTYFLKTEGSVRTLNLDQEWWFNDINEQWYIDGEFPEF
jgi:uncharacterized protein YchJ